MKHKLILILAMALVLLASASVAREAPTATRLDPADIPDRNMMPDITGQVGNLNPAVWGIPEWFTGQEEYKILFNPLETLNCPFGFQLQQVHMLMSFDEPTTFEVWVDLEDALWDDGLQCWVPGIEDCRSDTYTVTIDEPGLYDIGLPIDCDCAYMTDPTGAPYMYMLSMHFPTPFTATLVTDDYPTACTSWNNWAGVWEDLYNWGFPGNIIMYGDVTCCEDPVATEPRTWGGVKSLFR